MVDINFRIGEKVLARHGDGLLWPGKITHFSADSNPRTATISCFSAANVSSLLSYARPSSAEVDVKLIYKFGWNANRLLRQAQDATFGGDLQLKSRYVKVLEGAINEFFDASSSEEEEEAAVSPSREATAGVDVVPVLRTRSPAPEGRQLALRSARGIPAPDTYGRPTREAAARGMRKLYFVNDLDSAKKVVPRLRPNEDGIVCERCPQWFFTRLIDCVRHWRYIHIASSPPSPPLPSSPVPLNLPSDFSDSEFSFSEVSDEEDESDFSDDDMEEAEEAPAAG